MLPSGLPPVHPIDEGYSWMVCLGAFGINFFVNGGMKSIGILFIEVIEMFQAEKGLSALTMGLLAFGFAVFGAIGNSVGAMTTMRTACLIGAVLSFIGMFFTCVAPNIWIVILCLGLFTGIGYGFMYGPSLVNVGQYFNRRRSLATGLSCAGGSIGMLALPKMIRYIMDKYGFRGAILIYSGVVLHAIPAALLLRPVSFYDIKRTSKKPLIVPDTVEEKESNNNDEQSSKQLRDSATRVDKAARYKLVGSRLIPDSDQLQSTPNEPDNKMKPAASPAAPQPPPSPPAQKFGLRMFAQKLFDRDLLHSYAFIAYVIGLSLGQQGFIDTCIFLPPYAVERWNSKDKASYLIMTLGLADLVGHAGGGWFADLGLVRKPLIIGFAFLVLGVATFIVPFFTSFPVTVVYVVVMGTLGGTYTALIVVTIADMFGMAKLPSGVGFASFCMGVAILPLPPLFGKIREISGSYSIVLRICGVLLVLGGIVFYTIPMMQRKDKRRAAAVAAAATAVDTETIPAIVTTVIPSSHGAASSPSAHSDAETNC